MRNRGPAFVRYSLIPPSPACRRFVVPISPLLVSRRSGTQRWRDTNMQNDWSLTSNSRANHHVLTPRGLRADLRNDIAPVDVQTSPRVCAWGDVPLSGHQGGQESAE